MGILVYVIIEGSGFALFIMDIFSFLKPRFEATSMMLFQI